MHVFLDESGTHKQDGNTAIAVVFVANSDIEKVTQGIIEAEKQLSIDCFHWADHNWNFKEKFLHRVRYLPFTVKVITIKNPFSWSHYEKALRHFLANEDIGMLVIDGKKSRQYKREYKKILRGRGILLKKLIIGNDRSYPVLRIADFAAGLARSYSENSERPEVKRLYSMLVPKLASSFQE